MTVRRLFTVEPKVVTPNLVHVPEELASKGYVGWRGMAVIDLDDDAIKGWPTTEITLLAAPGAGHIVIPDGGAVFAVDATDGIYTGIDGAAELRIQYASGSGMGFNPLEESDTKISDLLANGSEVRLAYVPPDDLSDGALDDAHNQAIVAHFDNNGAGDLGGGHADNIGKIWFPYRVISLV
jgi:hypothetical protein